MRGLRPAAPTQRRERLLALKRVFSLALVALVVGSGVSVGSTAAQAAEVTFPIDLDFDSGAKGAVFSNPDFKVFGSPTYTGNAVADSGKDGVGWLQLTRNVNNQASALISNKSLPTAEGASFEFDFRAFAPVNQQLADGFSFFLTDGDDPSFVPTRMGALGAGLGYSSACLSATGYPGIERAYLGIGIDAYGNFSQSGGGSTALRNDGGNRPSSPSTVVLRGSGNGGAGSGVGSCGQEYRFAAANKLKTGTLAQVNVSTRAARYRRAQILVVPQPGTGPRIQVSISGLTPVGEQPTVWEYNLIDYQVVPGDGVFSELPENLRFGFAATTGGLNMITQIGSIRSSSAADAEIQASALRVNDVESDTATLGDTVSFTVNATNNGPSSINGTTTPGESRVYQDLSELGLENVSWTCESVNGGTCSTAGASGGRILKQDWYGPAGAGVKLTVTGTVASATSGGAKTSNVIIPTDFENNSLGSSSNATPTGSVIDSDVSNNSASLTLNVLAALNIEASSFSVTTTDVVADGDAAHTLTATVKDTDDLPRAGETVTFTAPAGVVLSSQTAVSGADGVASVTAKSMTAGTYTVSAKIGADQIGTDKQITFTSGDVSVGEDGTSTVSITSEEKIADGSDAHTVTATVLDANNNPVSGVTVDFTAETGATLSGASAVTGANGVATVTVTSLTAGSYDVTASVAGVALNGSPVSAVFKAGAPSVGVDGTSSFEATSGEVGADGVATHAATATVLDANNNPVSGVTVDFTAEAGATLSADNAVTGVDGVASVTISSVTAGSYDVTGSVAGTALKGSPATVTFVSGAASATTSSWTVTPGGPVTADGVSAYTATVTVLDANSNPVEGATIGFVVPAGLSQGSESLVTGADGKVAVTFTSLVADDYDLVAQLGADQIGATRVLSFEAGLPAADKNAISVSPKIVEANGVQGAVVTVWLFDAQGNLVLNAGDVVEVISTVGTHSGVTQMPDGSYRATFTSTAAGEAELNFTVDGLGSGATDTATFVATPATPVLNPTNGNPVTGTATPGQRVTITDANGVVIRSGTADATTGEFSILPARQLAHGEVVNAFATDEHGFKSGLASVTVDLRTPEPPVVDPSEGDKVTGCAEAGSTVTVRDKDGNVIGSAVVGDDCRFTVVLDPEQEEGSEITIEVTTPSGNGSEKVTVRVGLTSLIMDHDALRPGETQIARGFGYQPGEVVVGELRSEPYPLGTQTANELGEVVFEFTVPAGIEIGEHSVIIESQFSGKLSESFRVLAPTALSLTGGSILVTLGTAGALLLLGGAVMAVRRRRNAEAMQQV
ncbi:hypothetical protein G7067_00920 [Leucobacter insecticola]|uniref:Big-1 domain-containing protein n=1 Tax=Leucobacter insecticola TaxID=2714934 RepID=A0A6G8FFT9_9MICO|nr:invasin domain 3-containing protein [Leucobacter insecticola]QIM15300.1 hypothetical protein G7067_00920 [Leucobacter insecticola]